MSVLWQLERGGMTQSLGAWGFDRAVLRRQSFAPDELVLSMPVADVFLEPVFSNGDTVTLWRGSERWFKGTMTSVPAAGSMEGERQTYIVSNAWWKIERIIYQQPFYSKVRVGESVLPVGGLSSRVILGKDSWGNKITADAQIAKIGAYALTQGGGVFILAALPVLPEPPFNEARDITCAEAIRRMIGYAPDCVGWFNYAGATPTLNIQRRTQLSHVAIDLATAGIVQSIDSIHPRPDLVPAGVVITFLTTEFDETTGSNYVVENRQVAGAVTGDGVIFSTIELALQGTERAEVPPANLAAEYFAARSTLHYEGSLLLRESECSGAVRVGNRVSLLNGRAAWANMAAVVQTTVEDLVTGTTEVHFGPPDHLSAQDFVGMMTQFRNRPAPTDFAGTQDNGSAGIPEPAAGQPGHGNPTGEFGPDLRIPEAEREANEDAGKPSSSGAFLPAIMPTVDIPYCVDGILKSARVVGVPIT